MQESEINQQLLYQAKIKRDITNYIMDDNIKVLSYYGSTQRQSASESYWKCQCHCGNIFITPMSNFTKKCIKSCGCKSHLFGPLSFNWKGYGNISAACFNKIRDGAKIRNLSFEVTIKQIWDLFLKQDKKCALSGLDLCFASSVKSYDGTASLDRIDSSKGYVEGNLQWVNKKINIMKQDYDEKEFLKLCKIITNYQIRNNQILDLESQI